MNMNSQKMLYSSVITMNRALFMRSLGSLWFLAFEPVVTRLIGDRCVCSARGARCVARACTHMCTLSPAECAHVVTESDTYCPFCTVVLVSARGVREV